MTAHRKTKRYQEYMIVRDQFLDEHYYCQKCKAYIFRNLRTLHHFYGRIGRLLVFVPGFRMVCLKCHDWVHNHPGKARELDLLCPHGMWNDYDKAVNHSTQNYEASGTNNLTSRSSQPLPST